MNENLQATLDVTAAFHRLVDAGMATEEPRGINRKGIDTLSDLLAVLVFQAGGGQAPTDKVASASARATLSALGDLLAGDRPSPQTVQLLAEAARTART